MQTPRDSGRRAQAARQSRLYATTTREGSTPLSPPEPLPQKARMSLSSIYFSCGDRAVECTAVRFCAPRLMPIFGSQHKSGKYLLRGKIANTYDRCLHISIAVRTANTFMQSLGICGGCLGFGVKNILARRHLWYAAGPTLSCVPLRQARRERHGRRGRQNCSVKGYGFAEGVCGFCRGLPSVIFTARYEAG